MLKEFKKFAMKGNVVDLAVGIIIGGAFGKIVSSLVNDLIMPLIGLILGKVNFTNLKIVLKAAQGDKEELAIRYGNFIQTSIDFLIVAFSIFLVIKAINKFNKKKEEAPKIITPSKEEELLTEIRDILKVK